MAGKNMKSQVGSIDHFSGERLRTIEGLIRQSNMISDMFAPFVETLIHDLTKEGFPVLAIFNPQISGRKVGSATKVFGSIDNMEDMPSQVLTYQEVKPNGVKTRTSSMVYRDKDGIPFCALSINFDTSYIEQTVKNLMHFIDFEAPKEVSSKERKHFLAKREDIKNEILKAMIYLGVSPQNISKKDKRAIVAQLYKGGHFNKRGIVSILSEELSLTRATIYKYVKLAQEAIDSKK